MGVIIRARDPDLGRDLAVKALLDRHRNRPELVKRFLEEAQIGGQLQHPGIVPVHELGTFGDNRPYFAMKLVKGRTLAAYLVARKRPSDELAKYLGIFEHIAETVAYAHSRGVIHRDLKPSNVMIGSFGEVQVMDWGLAKVLLRGGLADDPGHGVAEETIVETARSGSDADASRAGSILGTPAYMPPEQALGDINALDERCDVFALGSILCEILTGEPAYTGSSANMVLNRARAADLGEAFARLQKSEAEVELTHLARHCLAVEPASRPRDASIVAATISAYLTGVQERLRRAELAKVAAQGRVRLTISLASSVLLFTAAAGGTWSFLNHQAAERQARTGREVDIALQESTLLWGRAKTAPIGDLVPWGEALEAAKRASALLARGDGDEATIRRTRMTLTHLIRERDQAKAIAEASARDRRLIERLNEINTRVGDRLDRVKAEIDYATAFREAGLAVDTRLPDELGAELAKRPDALALAAGLDGWSFERTLMDPPDLDGARRLSRIAQATDPDPWRNGLREAILQGDRPAIRRLAATIDPAKHPVYSVLRLADALRDIGDSGAAITLILPLQRRQPEEFWLNFELAAAYEAVRPPRLDESIRYATAMISLRPDSGFAHQRLGWSLQAASRMDEAIDEYREAVRLQPDFDQAHLALIAALKSVGKSAEANKEADALIQRRREAVRENNAATAPRIALIRMLVFSGRLPEALAASHEAIQVLPRDGFVRQTYAWALLYSEDWDGAIAECKEAIRLGQDSNWYAHMELGTALQRKNRWNEAVVEFRRALQISPTGFSMRIELIESLRNAGRLDEAVEASLEALQFQPGDSAIYYNLGCLHQKQNKLDEAIRAYKEAIRLKPGDSPAYDNLVFTLRAQGMTGEADSVITNRPGIGPAWPHIERIRALRHAGRLDEALAASLQAIALLPENGLIHQTHAWILLSRNELTEAIAAYETAIKLGQVYIPEAHHELGLAFLWNGDLDDAVGALREAVRVNPEFAAPYIELGNVYRLKGDYIQSLAMFRKANELGTKLPNQPYPLAKLIADAKSLVAIEKRIPALIKGDEPPKDKFECLLLAQLCQSTKRYAAAARFWAEAMKLDPDLAEDRTARPRYNEACAAISASCGMSRNESPLDGPEKTELRRLALDCLRAELAGIKKRVEINSNAGDDRDRELNEWRRTADFKEVRDAADLAMLPESERADWSKFWTEVDQLLGRR